MITFNKKKSTRSGAYGDNCVEVEAKTGFVGVSHSKTDQGQIRFTRDEWTAFLEGAKAGEFDID